MAATFFQRKSGIAAAYAFGSVPGAARPSTRNPSRRTTVGKAISDDAGPLHRVIQELGQRFGLAEIYVFGSRATEVAARVRGDAAESAASGSAADVDVGVRPLRGTRLGVDSLVAIADELERALGVPRTDVVLLPVASPFLALDIIRGELLYCADPDDQAEYELYVLRRAGDLAPYQRLRQQLALSRYEES